MSTVTFLQRYDSFPEQVKEDLSIIAEYLLEYYRPKANRPFSNLATHSDQPLSVEEQEMIVKSAEDDIAKGRVLSQLDAKIIAKTWRKK
jgi:hypothetical protein